jgi:hypothetical protein
MPSKAVVLFVISFLLVILIYDSVAEFQVFAKPKITFLRTCYKSTADVSGATSASVCCWNTYTNGKLTDQLCQKCNYDSSGNTVDCRQYTPARTIGNSTGLPGRLGTLLPASNNTGGLTNGQSGLPNRLGSALPVNNKHWYTPPWKHNQGSSRYNRECYES